LTLSTRIVACCALVASSARAEIVAFVNIASDPTSGQHTCTVLRDALLQRDPSVEKSVKRVLVLEEPSAHAPPTPKQVLEEVSRLLASAKTAYGRNEIDAAVESLAQGEAMLLSTEPLSETFAMLSDLERVNGLVALRQKDSNAADDAFRQAINLDPMLSTRDSAMGSYARSLKTRSGGQGKLDVHVEPLTAWVEIDGQKANAGLSPVLEAGTHFVSASRDGYVGQIQRVVVYKDKTTPVTLQLSQSTNEIELAAARKALLAAQSDASLALGAKRVAELSHARFVALVRPDDVAIYDQSKTLLSGFVPVPVAIEQLLKAIRGEVPAPLVTQEEIEKAREPEAPSDPNAWYKRPWVWGAAAGGVVLISIIVGASVAASRPPTYHYSVMSFCHASDCPPVN
jgi:hypothetical protein